MVLKSQCEVENKKYHPYIVQWEVYSNKIKIKILRILIFIQNVQNHCQVRCTLGCGFKTKNEF